MSPFMLIFYLLVRCTSRGDGFFVQGRAGRDGRIFRMVKFRTMRADHKHDPDPTIVITDSHEDVTPVGHFLRKFKLDELPQLLNVLRGEMSIVGPRPERPEFVKTLVEKIPFYRQRLCVKPGITGWAQINHEYGDTLEDAVIKLEYDLYYIKNLTPAIDAYIMFTTSKGMLLGRGAH